MYIIKYMTSQTGQTIIRIQILPKIQTSKTNLVIFGQFIEFNKGNTFLQKSCIK